MNIEFHYYITKYLALHAGFEEDEAEIIAYSSQLVEDNFVPFSIQLANNSIYQNDVSQTANISEPEKKRMRMYLLFHYFPGDPISPKVRRRDGKMHLFMTTPGNTIAQDIFYSTNQNDSLYMLGIGSHMLADTFSHQNFVGLFDELNSINGVWETMNPTIGHAQAGDKPDIPNLIWYDPRLIAENAKVNNVERILLAAKKVYSNYLFITSMPNKWNTIKKNLEQILAKTINETELAEVEKQQEVRIQQYKKLIDDLDADADYQPSQWLNAAVKETVTFSENRLSSLELSKQKITAKDTFERSHWYKFQEAIKEYQKTATNKIQPLLSQIELKEW